MLRELIYEIFKFIGDLNYWHVALLSALESTAFPVIIPVETVVIPMGYYAYLGTKSLPLLIISCTTGIVIGCLINYAFARYLGRSFIYKHAKFLHINVEKLQKLEEKFLKHGRLLMFVGRFVPIPAFKHIITIPAGMAKMPVHQFVFYNALGGLIFSTSMLLIGYFFGSSEELWRQALGRFVIVCLALFGIYLLIRFIISMLIKRNNRNNVSYLEEITAEQDADTEDDDVDKDRSEIFIGNYKIGRSKNTTKKEASNTSNKNVNLQKGSYDDRFFSKKNIHKNKKDKKKSFFKRTFFAHLTMKNNSNKNSGERLNNTFKARKPSRLVKRRKPNNK